jgi:hypothetical protein
MRTSSILFACVFLATATLASETASDGDREPAVKPDPGLLDEAGRSQPPRQSLTAEEEAGLIDKRRIAEETARKAVGLREAGNPHIPVEFLVSRFEADPEKESVDGNLLRERLISQVDRHSSYADTAVERSPSPQETEPVALEPQTNAPSEGSDRRWIPLAITGMCLIGAVVLFLVARPRVR